jgi:hypothetical protein
LLVNPGARPEVAPYHFVCGALSVIRYIVI